jgi:hypothetical protein
MARPLAGSGVVRIRQVTPSEARSLEALRSVSQLLDSAFQVPGTSYRVGLDPILGLIPGLGDLVSPLFTIGILLQARRLRVPKIVQARMLVNVAIDSVLGIVPLVGDLFDFAWKANNLNMALLERHAYEERPPEPGDWAFVTLMIALVAALAIVPLVLVGWLFSAIGARLA